MNPDLISLLLEFAPDIIDCIRRMDDAKVARVQTVLRSNHGQQLLNELAAALSASQPMGA